MNTSYLISCKERHIHVCNSCVSPIPWQGDPKLTLQAQCCVKTLPSLSACQLFSDDTLQAPNRQSTAPVPIDAASKGGTRNGLPIRRDTRGHSPVFLPASTSMSVVLPAPVTPIRQVSTLGRKAPLMPSSSSSHGVAPSMCTCALSLALSLGIWTQ